MTGVHGEQACLICRSSVVQCSDTTTVTDSPGENVISAGPLGHILQILPGCVLVPASPYFVEK